MSKEILFIDMDGVVANFNSKMIELHPHTKDIFDKPETHEGGKIIEELMMEVPRIFLELEPIEGAIDTVHRLSEFYEIYFLSTPFWELPESFMDKRHWLENHFGELAYKRLILSHRKDLKIGEYLVDDRLANGSEKFTGRHLHFGQEDFPTWVHVEDYLVKMYKINNPQYIE